MACCEYHCLKCSYEWFENGAKCCPRCWSNDLHVIYDEQDGPCGNEDGFGEDRDD